MVTASNPVNELLYQALETRIDRWRPGRTKASSLPALVIQPLRPPVPVERLDGVSEDDLDAAGGG